MAKYSKKELKIALNNYRKFLQTLSHKEVIEVAVYLAKEFYPTAVVQVHNPKAKIYLCCDE